MGEGLPVVRGMRDSDTRANRIAGPEEGPEVRLEGDPQGGNYEMVPAAVAAAAAAAADVAGTRFLRAQRARATALS
jgi:hypothetical protein